MLGGCVSHAVKMVETDRSWVLLVEMEKWPTYLSVWVFLPPWVSWVRWQRRRYHHTSLTAAACTPSKTICTFHSPGCRHNTFSYPQNYWWQMCSWPQKSDCRPVPDLCKQSPVLFWHCKSNPETGSPCKFHERNRKQQRLLEAFGCKRTLVSNHLAIEYSPVSRKQPPTMWDMLILIHWVDVCWATYLIGKSRVSGGLFKRQGK